VWSRRQGVVRGENKGRSSEKRGVELVRPGIACYTPPQASFPPGRQLWVGKEWGRRRRPSSHPAKTSRSQSDTGAGLRGTTSRPLGSPASVRSNSETCWINWKVFMWQRNQSSSKILYPPDVKISFCPFYRGADKSLAPTRKETSSEACQGRSRFQQHRDASCHQGFSFSCKARRRRKFTPFWQKH